MCVFIHTYLQKITLYYFYECVCAYMHIYSISI